MVFDFYILFYTDNQNSYEKNQFLTKKVFRNIFKVFFFSYKIHHKNFNKKNLLYVEILSFHSSHNDCTVSYS